MENFYSDVPVTMVVLPSKNYKNVPSAIISCINWMTMSTHQSTHSRMKINGFRVQLT
jgi:hypothetical protein